MMMGWGSGLERAVFARSGTRDPRPNVDKDPPSVHGQVSDRAKTGNSRPDPIGLLVSFILLLPSPALGQDARQIVQESQKRAEAASQRYEGTLKVIDSRGKISDKRWEFTRLGSHGQSKAVLRFTAPAEVKGVALLVVNHPDRASDQWMWTPALARERRIALQDRSTRFFGTDFSFEDLEERDVDQYEYRLVPGTETIGGATCWKIESQPRQSKSSQYTRSLVWIRQDNYALAQIENYVKDQVVRRMKYAELEQVQNIWTAKRLEMTDLRRNSTTILNLEKLQYNVPMRDEDFTLLALRK
jgi:Outer membrane lipoprotein-sorting protein